MTNEDAMRKAAQEQCISLCSLGQGSLNREPPNLQSCEWSYVVEEFFFRALTSKMGTKFARFHVESRIPLGNTQGVAVAHSFSVFR